METQVKSARPKQKNTKIRKVSDRDERKLSSGPASDLEQPRRLFVPATNKRAVARFAKGPSDTGGFTYPRHTQPAETFEPIVEIVEPIVEIVEQIVTENLATFADPVLEAPEPMFESIECAEAASPEPVVANDEQTNHEEQLAASTVEEQPLGQQVEEADTMSTMVEVEETDDTVGPGDRSSDNDSSEEEASDVESVKSTPIAPPKIAKPATPSIARKVTAPPSPAYRKVVPAPPLARSSWSKFLPLVIEIKATIPYPMHLLGLSLLFVTGLLLRLLYQFGADLGGEMDLQAQLIRLAKLVFLFVAVAMCVNFVEDNKELQHKEQASPTQPKLRPSKMSKNKKKMMMKL